MGVMYKILEMFEWTDTDSCIVQLLRILPWIRQPPQPTPQGRRPRGRPPIPPSLIPTSKMPPSLAFLSPNPKLEVLPGASVRRGPRRGSQVKPILRLIPSFSAAVRKQAKRSRDPVPPVDGFLLGGASLRLCTHRRHGTVLGLFVGPPMCISLFGKLSFSASPDGWMDGMDECGGG